MAWLTLATGTDRWEEEGAYWTLKKEGPLWILISAYMRSELFIILKPEVAEWCWGNIGAYRLVEHIPSDEVGPHADDSWRIEFKSDTDMAYFKLRWVGQ